MTGKRFKIYNKETLDTYIEDTQDCYSNGNTKTYWFGENEDFCDLFNKLNELAEENEQLKIKLENVEDARKSYKEDWKACTAYCDEYKNEIHDLKDNINGLLEENEQLKQFKQNVFGLIDKNLEKDKYEYEMTYEDYLNGRIEVLEELKKELEE